MTAEKVAEFSRTDAIEIDRLKGDRDALRQSLRRLRSEVRATLSLAEDTMRQTAGSSNVGALISAVEDAESLL